MEYTYFGDEGLHGIDNVEDIEAVLGVIKSDKRIIEYLISFHQNITYAPKVF